LPDSEIHVMIDEVVRDQDIFMVQPCSVPVNDNLVELLLYLDAFRRASAHSISVVIPYFPYARQDRMARGREAISARVVANLLENQGASRVIFIDIHNRAIQGFFNIPVDPLSALPLLADYFRKPEFENAAVVSPDVGRADLAAALIRDRREAREIGIARDVRAHHVRERDLIEVLGRSLRRDKPAHLFGGHLVQGLAPAAPGVDGAAHQFHLVRSPCVTGVGSYATSLSACPRASAGIAAVTSRRNEPAG